MREKEELFFRMRELEEPVSTPRNFQYNPHPGEK
jgi:hypothetical protein